VEVGDGLGCVWVGFEDSAAVTDDGPQIGKRINVFVDDGLVDELPQAFGRLELRAVGRKIDEPEALWDGEPRLGMPSGPVEDQGAPAPRSGLSGKSRQKTLEEPF
jgi:hypothetical protein